MYVQNYLSQEKNKHSKIFEVIVSGTHTGLGIVSVYLSQIGKSQDSWGTIYYSTQKSVASVVGNKYPQTECYCSSV